MGGNDLQKTLLEAEDVVFRTLIWSVFDGIQINTFSWMANAKICLRVSFSSWKYRW
ncbi:MAG: hypothetical protein R3C26_14640 [Calditrichia bacterium]